MIDLARAASWQVGGLVCPALFEGGQKTGIEAEALNTGPRLQLAWPGQAGQPQTGLATRRWQFDAEVLAWGTRILQQATPCDLLVVDELGPLKFERGEGWTPPGSGRPQGSTPPVLGWDCPGSFWLSPA